MSFSTTTLSSAIARDDTTILAASLTGFVANGLVRVDSEIMKVVSVPSAATIPVPVLRGQEGTAQVAHPVSANVLFGATATATGTDWTQQIPGAAQSTPFGASRNRIITSYSASGAITLPPVGTDGIAVLNGTAALTMTLADPVTAQDGDKLLIVSNGKAASTVTNSSGLGANTTNSDVLTFHATQKQAVELVACAGTWQVIGCVAGAAAVNGVGLG